MNYCTSCGIQIPKGQSVCSMCYGDPWYGTDGYYLDYLQNMYDEAAREEEEYYWEEEE